MLLCSPVCLLGYHILSPCTDKEAIILLSFIPMVKLFTRAACFVQGVDLQLGISLVPSVLTCQKNEYTSLFSCPSPGHAEQIISRMVFVWPSISWLYSLHVKGITKSQTWLDRPFCPHCQVYPNLGWTHLPSPKATRQVSTLG